MLVAAAVDEPTAVDHDQHRQPARVPAAARRAGAPGGVNTFRYRQSSVSDRGPLPLASCGQRFPYDCALRMPGQGVTGWGAAQRSAPTGGAA